MSKLAKRANGIKRESLKKGRIARFRQEHERVGREVAEPTPTRASGPGPRSAVVASRSAPDDSPRKMPVGVCFGCAGTAPLPPFGGGLCFGCATTGAAGIYTPSGGAVSEDEDARRTELPWFDPESLSEQVQEYFRDAQFGHVAEVDVVLLERESRREAMRIEAERPALAGPCRIRIVVPPTPTASRRAPSQTDALRRKAFAWASAGEPEAAE